MKSSPGLFFLSLIRFFKLATMVLPAIDWSTMTCCRRSFIVAVAAVALILLGGSPAVVSASNGCSRVGQHEYEVCSAYTLNASIEARLPFYKFSRSQSPGYYQAVQESCTGRTLGSAVVCRMHSRYYGSARAYLGRQARGWPVKVKASLPRIRILSVRSSLSGGTAILHTRETWLVKSPKGKRLFGETNHLHVIRMRVVQGLLLHKWVVTSIR